MSMYDCMEVYPSSFDEVDQSQCEDCNFECGTIGYCRKECGDNYIVCTLLVNKGYVQANIDFGYIQGKNVPGVELYKRQCGKFMRNMNELGHKCTLFQHPMGRNYLATVIIDDGVQPIELCHDFLKLDVVK